MGPPGTVPETMYIKSVDTVRPEDVWTREEDGVCGETSSVTGFRTRVGREVVDERRRWTGVGGVDTPGVVRLVSG